MICLADILCQSLLLSTSRVTKYRLLISDSTLARLKNGPEYIIKEHSDEILYGAPL